MRMARVAAVALLTSFLAAEEIEPSLEFGTASGEPGEVVEVSVFAAFDSPLRSFSVVSRFDGSRLQLIDYTVSGSDAAEADPLSLLYQAFSEDTAVFGIFPARQASRSYRVEPGPRRHLGQLRFRVRATAGKGGAEVVPVEETIHTSGSTQLELDLDGDSKTVAVTHLTAGSVRVLASDGPRPVASLGCEQFLDRARLAFTPSEAYDAIEVRRDGATVATLPGSATGHDDPLPGTGTFRYEVVAMRAGERSVAVECDVLAHSPAAPPVKDLACGEDGITWSNPFTYDRITVFRDGEPLADLPGSAQSFTDPDRPRALGVYTVVGELEGFLSPDVHCLANGSWMMEIGDVEAPLGADLVRVPVYVTTLSPARAFGAYIDIDGSRFELVEDYDAMLELAEGHPEPELFLLGNSTAYQGRPVVGIVYDFHPPREREKDLPAGLRQRVVDFLFRPVGEFRDGDVFRVGFHFGSFTILETTGQNADVLLPGEIRFGSSPVPAVEKLDAAHGIGGQDGGDTRPVALSWANAASYDRIVIERNGRTVAEIDGSEGGYIDNAPPGIYTYKVVAVTGGVRSFPATAFLSTARPRGAFLRGDADHDGSIGISDPIVTLLFLFAGGRAPRCEDAADADDDGRIRLTDPVLTLRYLFLGNAMLRSPGTRYPWFDPTPDLLGCAAATDR